MAPGLLFLLAFDLLGLAGVSVSFDTLFLDLLLRGVGLALFVLLAIRNRRESDVGSTPSDTAEPA